MSHIHEAKKLSKLYQTFEEIISNSAKTPYEKELKLLYQTEHLEKVALTCLIVPQYLNDLKSSVKNHLVSVQCALEAIFDLAVKNAFQITTHKVQINASTKELFGDYQCNSAMRLSKELKDAPSNIAAKIISNLPKSDMIEKTEFVNPGFINIWISKQFIIEELAKITTVGVKAPFVNEKLTIVIDMSSPNIAKEMHVGHLRSTIIGDSISRLLRFFGHRVLKINHIGDWGTQFGMLIAHLNEVYPDRTVPPPISDLQAFYKVAKTRFDSEEEFKSRAYSAVVKLQQGDPEYIRAWQQICDISRKEFMKIYERLQIEDLIERGESFYQSRMQDLVQDLDERKLLQLDEGRKLLWPPGCEIPLTIVKSDGGYTYDTSDMAALLQRLYEEKADWVLYVVDLGQGVHFNCIKMAAEYVGFYKPLINRVEHVGFGVVLGEDKKKFKTRSGDTVRLIDLLDEGLERSKQRLIEKGRHTELTETEFKAAQEAVAYGCIKYADLSHNRTSDYIFSFDKMLDDKGNTAVYLLYAYTRIRSIARSAGISGEQLSQITKEQPIVLEHPTEWNLAKALCRYADILLKMQNDFFINSLCDYLYDLSCTFTSFYDACYCIERERETGNLIRINMNRLLLCEGTARIMKSGFDILGLQTVDRM